MKHFAMKLVVFLTICAVAAAKRFELTNNKTTCAILDVDGVVEVKAFNVSGEPISDTLSIPLTDFKLDADEIPYCGEVSGILSMIITWENVVYLAFERSSSIGYSGISPSVQFKPNELIPALNYSESVVFTAGSFGNFSETESLKCFNKVQHTFNTSPNPTQLTFDIMATTENFQIQFGDLSNGTYGPGVAECAADLASTSIGPNSTITTPSSNNTGTTPGTNTTVTTPTVTTMTTTVPPLEMVNITVSDGNGTSCIILQGRFVIAVTVDDGAGNVSTGFLNVPETASASGSCYLTNTTQTANLNFDNDWSLGFIFSKPLSDEVSISEISVTYDIAVFGAKAPEKKNVVIPKTEFLKSGLGGYYQCSSNTTLATQGNVTITGADLKYKAFNTGNSTSFSGDVTDCSDDDDDDDLLYIIIPSVIGGLIVVVIIACIIKSAAKRKSAGYSSF